MANIVPQCGSFNCYLDGKILLGDIEEVNVPDLEILTIDADARIGPLNVELKVRGDGREILEAVGKAAGKPNTLKICAMLKNNARASWKMRGKPLNIPIPIMPTTTLRLNVYFYEHIIDGEEKYYIDILKNIRRIDGVDRLSAIREAVGI